MKDSITSTARNSRNKLVTALLEKEIQANLGLSGSGQDVSFMRSTLVYTGILQEKGEETILNLIPEDRNLEQLLTVIDCFLSSSEAEEGLNFQDLYDKLTLPEHGFGIKKGLIPIYLSVILHFKREYLLITTNDEEVPISCDTLNSINEAPHKFVVTLDYYDREKEGYLQGMRELFQDYLPKNQRFSNIYHEITASMHRWYLHLPQYTKSAKTVYKGHGEEDVPLDNEYLKLFKELKGTVLHNREFILEKLPIIFGSGENYSELLHAIFSFRQSMDKLKSALTARLIYDVKDILAPQRKNESSLYSLVKNFLEKLNKETLNHLFPQGEERILEHFKAVNHDEATFVDKLGQLVTQLRTDDWNRTTVDLFYSSLQESLDIIMAQQKVSKEEKSPNSKGYTLTIVTGEGKTTKNFEKVEKTKRGDLLSSEIETALDEMGASISVGEKRQILIHHLEKLC